MCCFLTVLVFLGPRFADIVWWIINPNLWNRAFSSALWPILGIIFLPWTTLMYVLVFPGGLTFFEWLMMALFVFFDIASYAGGGYGNRQRFAR